jgi:hypothetical protein
MQVMEQFVEDMCDCHDSQCSQRVVDEMTRWSQDQAKNNREPPKPSDEDIRRFAELGERMGMCMQKAMSAGPAAGSATP